MTQLDTLPAATEVAIVGAGPTGLALACVLAQERVPFVLLDRLEAGLNTSRAAVVHARTLEALEAIGAADRLRALGHVVPQFTLRDRGRALLQIRFDVLPSRYPHTLMLPQCDTEAVLGERLRELGGVVHRGVQVVDVHPDAKSAAVTLQNGTGPSRTIRARYVVGSDGMHSVVREKSGIEFAGAPYPHSFVLADVRMTWPLSDREVNLLVSPQGLTVVAPLPGGRHRIVATVDDAPENPSLADVQRLLDERGPSGGRSTIHELVWSSRFRVHHRLARCYRAGRLFVAGDAAHVHSPAGGQGMNTGIQDGLALGRLLADVFHRRAPESRLDDYERVRRPIAERVVAVTDTMTRMATVRSAPARAMRNLVVGTLGRIPAFRRKLAMELSGLINRETATAGG